MFVLPQNLNSPGGDATVAVIKDIQEDIKNKDTAKEVQDLERLLHYLDEFDLDPSKYSGKASADLKALNDAFNTFFDDIQKKDPPDSVFQNTETAVQTFDKATPADLRSMYTNDFFSNYYQKALSDYGSKNFPQDCEKALEAFLEICNLAEYHYGAMSDILQKTYDLMMVGPDSFQALLAKKDYDSLHEQLIRTDWTAIIYGPVVNAQKAFPDT